MWWYTEVIVFNRWFFFTIQIQVLFKKKSWKILKGNNNYGWNYFTKYNDLLLICWISNAILLGPTTGTGQIFRCITTRKNQRKNDQRKKALVMYWRKTFERNVYLLCNFIEIELRHGCSPVNLPHIFRIPFPRNTSGRLLLNNNIKKGDWEKG